MAEAIYSKNEAVLKEHLPASAKKSRRVQFVRKAFFNDSACTMVNQSLMHQLDLELNANGSTQKRKRPNQEIYSRPIPTPSPQQLSSACTNLYPSPMRQTLTYCGMRTSKGNSFFPFPYPQDTAHTSYSTYRPNNRSQQMSNATLPNMTTHKQPSRELLKKPKACHDSRHVKVKREQSQSAFNPDRPQTAKEHQFVVELQHMGFTNKREILDGIRQSGGSTSEDVMVWMISQREEAEEARKEDEARLRSEELRKEHAEREAQATREKLDSAKVPDLYPMFPNSWILERIPKPERLQAMANKAVLTKLLQLENKGRKWYGTKLPSYYFYDLATRMMASRVGKIDWLPSEFERLESALFNLEEQQGGVPRLFLAAQEAHPEGEAQDDKEIVIVGRRMTRASPSNGDVSTKSSENEIIEID